jgi:group I intron endonuclease
MHHIVYLIENNLNKKKYIGYTKYTIEKRWKQHCNRSIKNINTPFYNAIKKYGMEVWTLSTLCECYSADEAKEKEIYFIEKYDTYNNGYNATLGGDGNKGIIMSEESNKKRSEALKNKPKNYNRMHGKKHTSETLLKMRKPKNDKSKYQTESFKNKMREVQKEMASQRRSLTKETYDQMMVLLSQGKSKKQVSLEMSISYDIVKKWSCRKW